MSYFKKHRFISNVATMLAGNVGAQTIGLIAAPFITRLYMPGDFGIMVFIVSTTGIFSTLACFRYQNAIVLPKEDDKSYNLLAISILSTFIVALVLLVLVAGFKNFIANKSGIPAVREYLWYIPAGVLLFGIRESIESLHTRYKNFRLIAISKIIRPFFSALFKIIPALLVGASVIWLVVGNVFGSFAATVFLSALLIITLSKHFKNISFKKIRQVAREYIKFPKYGMPTGALNSVSQNFPVLLFAYLFSQEVVGFYGLANMVLRRPIALMSQSLSKVFLQKSAEVENKGDTHFTNLKKTTLGLVIIGIMPFTVLTFFGGQLFGIIFGSQWVIAGRYAQILAPWLFLLFINKPANGIYIVKKKLRFIFNFNIISIILRLAAIVGGYQIIPKPWFVIAIFSTVGVLTNIYFIYYAFSISKR